MLLSKAFNDVNSNLANDNAFGDSGQVDLSLARFKLTSSKAFDLITFKKERQRSKLKSNADFSKITQLIFTLAKGMAASGNGPR